MRKSTIAGIVLVGVCALAVASYFGTGWLVYSQLADVRSTCDKHRGNTPDHFTNVSNWPGEYDFSPWFVPEYELVRFPSRQPGVEIAAYYLKGEPDAPAVIVLDGIGGCKQAQAALLPAGMLWHHGFNVLIIDLRDTGDSSAENGYSGIGSDEYLDALGAWDWLTDKKGFDEKRVGILGNSLGAASVLIAFQQEPRVAAVAVNSPFANLPQIIREQLVKNGFPAFFAPAIVIMARIVEGEDLLKYNPLDAIRSAGHRPVFVIHSTADETVDVHHSQQLQAAAEEAGVDATFWYIDVAGHVQAPGVYPEEFESRITEFFARSLNP